MAVTGQQHGPSTIQGDVWGARAHDYAELDESQNHRLFRDGIRLTGIGPGTVVLDLGCGPGAFCRLAADAGAQVTGIDTSPAMLQIARERVPTGRFDQADLQSLPYQDRCFDVVTAFHSLMFAAEPLAALIEARRVAKPGALILIVVFGREERIELAAKWRALAPLLPPAASRAPDPLALSRPGALEDLVLRAGLTVTEDGYLEGHFEFPDEATMLRAQRSTPMALLAERAAGQTAVNDAIIGAFAPCRTSSGGYRIEFESRYLKATA
jgi:SAM-dependent methyltransferase